MLTIGDLWVHRSAVPVLRGVSLQVGAGEIVALLGRNGAGRSTLAQAVMGLIDWQGRAVWRGTDLAGLAPHAVARLGVGYLPERRDVFTRLTVQQNLALGCRSGADVARATERVFCDFPALAARRDLAAGRLSGGEQQMLAFGRVLMGEPDLLVLDEPSEGLALQMAETVAGCLRAARARGAAVLLIEQRRPAIAALADRVLVMERGQIVESGPLAALAGL